MYIYSFSDLFGLFKASFADRKHEFAGVKKEASACWFSKLMGKVTLTYYFHYDNIPRIVKQKKNLVTQVSFILGSMAPPPKQYMGVAG